MRSTISLLPVVGALYTGIFLTCTAAYAQSYEEQAKTILQLFESGQKDTAYALLEPLKKSARFVPAVLYTRAQMTPDDRALPLYKEAIAMEPGGTWADRAAFQLVSRYADKRDSSGAHHWLEVLRVNYPRSPLVADAEDLLDDIRTWRSPEEDLADATRGESPKSEPPKSDSPKTEPSKPDAPKAKDPAKGKDAPKAKEAVKETAKGKETPQKEPSQKDAPKEKDTKKTEPKKTEVKKVADKKGGDDTVPAETYKASGMKGYALQVGLFPSRDQADLRSGELKKKNIRSVALPKTIKGKKQYALVVGPYQSIEEANKKKSTVAGACNCQAFIVKVQ